MLLLVQATISKASDAINALMLHRSNGQNVTIMLDQQPVVTFSNSDLVVATHMNTVIFPASEILKFSYVSVENDGISNPSVYGMICAFSENMLNVNNLKPSSSLQVYSADGTLIYSAFADNRGKISIPMQGTTGTVYLVKTSSMTLKIRKP